MGQQLSEARQRRHLTLADISRTTKIPVHLLEAIERNDIDHLPQGFFARAFVRAYANEVGVSADDLLDNFEPIEIEQVGADLPISNVTVEEPPSSRSLYFLLALVAAWSVGFASKAPRSESPQVVTASPVPAADRAEVVASTVPPATTDVVFEIRSPGACLVAVTADGRPVTSRLVASREPVTVKARDEIILRVGDTGTCATAATVAAAKPSMAKRVAADAQAVLATPPAAESSPATSDAVIPQADQAPAPAPVEQF